MSADTEAWVADGELYVPDAAKLCADVGAVYLTIIDGTPYAGIPGKGEQPLADLVAEMGKPKIEHESGGKVATIKPASRRTE
jgi:hypothetical protein